MTWPNHALQRTAAGRRGCNRRASWPPSLDVRCQGAHCHAKVLFIPHAWAVGYPCVRLFLPMLQTSSFSVGFLSHRYPCHRPCHQWFSLHLDEWPHFRGHIRAIGYMCSPAQTDTQRRSLSMIMVTHGALARTVSSRMSSTTWLVSDLTPNVRPIHTP